MSDPELREGEEAPPPGVRAMAFVRWLILLAVGLLAFGSVYSSMAAPDDHAAHGHAPGYYCPMHPEITSEVPGECPICHMTLEPIPEERRQASEKAKEEAKGSRDARETAKAAPGPAPSAAPRSSATPPPPPPPDDVTDVTLALDRVQAIGVRTELVESSGAIDALRVAASVEAPERSAAEVHVRTAGFVETIAVREVGARVRAGQPLATVYSPDVFRAEQELLSVLDWKSVAGGAPPPVEDARRRLELMGVPRATVDRIVEKKEAIRAFPIASPIDGFIVSRKAVLGAYATPETALFEVVGLDRVYVVASADPSILAGVREGDSARFTSPALPGKEWTARVDLVYPVVDAALRLARVRFSLKNPDTELRPGLTGTAEFAGVRGTPELRVPADAVVATGRATYVFVVEGEGRYSPRTVEVLGDRGDRLAVRGGISAGDRVVSRATFLVDAESRLRASFVRRRVERPAAADPGKAP